MEPEGYMAVWLERDDGFSQLVAASFNTNMAYLRDFGWTFPRMKIEQNDSGQVEINRIGEASE